jgi:CelD/BcsL family acetyltransferase involved in cellulose biosynthesis
MLAGHWQNFKCEILPAEKAGETLLPWQALSATAAESSGFNAPELQLPILKHHPALALCTIAHGPDLIFAMPLQRGIYFNSNVITPLSAGGACHVYGELKDAILGTFINSQTKPFLFKATPENGIVHKTLKHLAPHYAVLESWQRACLNVVGTYDNWLQTNFDQKRRKEFKRLRNRLAEQGELKLHSLQPADSTEPFIADFLALEASGWKGKKGTAIAANAKLAAALAESAALLHKAGKLRFWTLKFNNTAIASLFAIVEGNHAWLGKIGYDENFAKYSPGALIILDCTEHFFAEKNITQVDSSAIPNHPLIDRIWRDRLSMISFFVAPAKVSNLNFKFVTTLAHQKLFWRSKLRDFYYKAKGQKRS